MPIGADYWHAEAGRLLGEVMHLRGEVRRLRGEGERLRGEVVRLEADWLLRESRAEVEVERLRADAARWDWMRRHPGELAVFLLHAEGHVSLDDAMDVELATEAALAAGGEHANQD